MSHLRILSALSLLILASALPAGADQYDDCVAGCEQNVAPCIEQARLTAGNVQEEADLIAACEKRKADCLVACSAAEAQPPAQPEPAPQEQPPGQ